MGQREAARQFAANWSGRGDEKRDSIPFWFSLLHNVFGVADTDNFTVREMPVHFDGAAHFADIYLPSTKVLIEQKSFGCNLFTDRNKDNLTPFQQALRYAEHMKDFPRWIVTCNFAEFHIYYAWKIQLFLEDEQLKPVIVKLEELPDLCERMKFLVDPNDISILDDVKFSKTALEIIDKVYDGFKKHYVKYPVDGWQDYLYKICVRLVFCFYADDSKLFNEKVFAKYLQQFNGKAQLDALQKIFDVLNTPLNLRGNFDDALKNFPYVNGRLFEDKIIFPDIHRKERTTPIDGAFNDNLKFHWENISPPIFGALFEDALNPDTRREGGMHYTSYENIHKVINPLFLDDLRTELNNLLNHSAKKERVDKLKTFQNKLASLTFLDPACGSGNFLTETFLSLRGLENEALRAIYKLDKTAIDAEPVKVSIENFFGIEINAYAVAIAKLAMCIANLQMLHKTELILHRKLEMLPLKGSANIICANALQIDWAELITPDKLNFIIGNPPFIGYTYQTAQQKADLLTATKLKTKKIDYVVSWYYKTADFIQGTKIEATFVSTNSITQGEQVAVVWKKLFEAGIKINFAYRTFKWISDSQDMAAVHCVIIGFSMKSRRKKFIYDGNKKIPAQNINAYLYDAENIFIPSRTTPICDVPQMIYGNKPAEGGNLIVEAYKYDDFNAEEKKFIRPFIGAEEFINGKKRYCLWLVGVSQTEIDKMPNIKVRVDAVKKFRLQSKKAATREDADRANEFQEIRQPSTNYLLIPRVSSENRRYIPIGFISPEIIASDAVHIIPDATIYHFGVLISSVHMAWMRAVCGRLEMRYRYSKDIVYNNFIWCAPTDEQRRRIEVAAQMILEVIKNYPSATLADLYEENKMPADLREAHAENDAAVMAAYGFDENLSESEIVAALMKLYEKMT